MLKLKYKDLRSGQFMGSFAKLAGYNGVSTKTAINIARIKKAIESEGDIAQEAFIKLVKNFAELDEKGEIKPLDGQPNTYHIPDDKMPAWTAALKEFEETEIEIDRMPITYRDIDGSRMSANEILALDPLLTEEEMGPKGIVKKPELPANA